MSKINKIKEMLQNVLSQFAKMSTDKGILTFSEDELEVGTAVMLVAEDGSESKPEDGEYKNDEGTVYVLADGKVSEIREPEDEKPEEPQAEEPKNEEMSRNYTLFHRMAMAFESYEEKERKIIDAIRALGIESYLVEAGDDYAIIEYWAGEEYKLRKYAISWNEGEVVVGESVEVKSAYVPVEMEAQEPEVVENVETELNDETPKVDETPKEEELSAEEPVVDENLARIEQLEAELSAAQDRIKELEETPAAAPAKEQFNNMVTLNKTNDRGINRLTGILGAK